MLDGDIQATCSCGDIYCRACISIFSPKELEAVIADAKAQGHIVDTPL